MMKLGLASLFFLFIWSADAVCAQGLDRDESEYLLKFGGSFFVEPNRERLMREYNAVVILVSDQRDERIEQTFSKV